jgi:glutaredoxin
MATDPPHVTLYMTVWCGSVYAAKRYLERRGIAYTEVDIDAVPEAAARLEGWTGGYRTVPTFEIAGQIVIDFDVPALEAILGAAPPG